MKSKIVYLKPRSSYRPAMRSDTLWGAICWEMHMLYGEEKLKKFIACYASDHDRAEGIYLSSAFPYLGDPN